MPLYRHNILLWLVAMALVPAALASCDGNIDGVNMLYCSKGFPDGKRLADLPSVQQFSGCIKLLLSECMTFDGLGYSCNNPACDAAFGGGDVSKLPMFLYPARRATQCINGCSRYMPRAQLCTICKAKADAALNAFGDIVWVISRTFVEQSSIITQGTPRRLLEVSQRHPNSSTQRLDIPGAVQPSNSSLESGKTESLAASQLRSLLSNTGTEQVSVRTLGDMTAAWMDRMDATDMVVRKSINSPVPEGTTFAKFGKVEHGVLCTTAINADGLCEYDPSHNSFKPDNPLYKPVDTPGLSRRSFPVEELAKQTARLYVHDKENGPIVAYGMQLLIDGDVAKLLKLVGFDMYGTFTIPGTSTVIYGVDPWKAPIRTVGELVAQFSDQLVDGVGGAASKLTGALNDVVGKLRERLLQGKKGALYAKPTSTLSWMVDYQQTMQCYYACLTYVVECLGRFKVKAPDCHEECKSSKGIEALAGFKAQQIYKFSKGC